MLDLLAHQAATIAARGDGASRLRSPDDLVARMSRRLAEFGITRVAETTRLDSVGWPVWAAVRPNAPTLAVSQGKGATDPGAQASAIMEAVEMACAEDAQATMVASAREMAAAGRAVDLLPGFVRRNHVLPDREARLGWMEGYDLLQDRAVWVPADAVRIDPGAAWRPYWQSSDGLGSGSVLVEAVVHGLCERIERDAAEIWNVCDDGEVAAACIDPASFGFAEVERQRRAIARAGLQLRLYDITSDVDVPTFFAAISPPADGRESRWTHFDLSTGTASRLVAGAAAAAAIGEALQSRVTTISGARDDYSPDLYGAPIAPDLLVYARSSPGPLRSGLRRGEADFAAALPCLLAALRTAGIGSAVVVVLHADEDFAAAKVIVPELEHPPGARAVEHGARLRAALRIAA